MAHLQNEKAMEAIEKKNASLSEPLAQAENRVKALRHKLAQGGERIVLMAGIPFGKTGSTNVLHVARLIGDELERHNAAEASGGG